MLYRKNNAFFNFYRKINAFCLSLQKGTNLRLDKIERIRQEFRLPLILYYFVFDHFSFDEIERIRQEIHLPDLEKKPPTPRSQKSDFLSNCAYNTGYFFDFFDLYYSVYIICKTTILVESKLC